MNEDFYAHIAQHIQTNQFGTRQKKKRQLVLFFLTSVLIPMSLSVSYGQNMPTAAIKIIECK